MKLKKTRHTERKEQIFRHDTGAVNALSCSINKVSIHRIFFSWCSGFQDITQKIDWIRC